jgi:Protein of unknown function (DUF2862)
MRQMNIGQKVRVRKIRDVVEANIGRKLGEVGTVVGAKIVDGSDIGVIVQFEDKTSAWFFEEELELL